MAFRSAGILAVLISMTCSVVAGAADTAFVFDTPSDDRWHYPFNFTPGFRPVASAFGAADIPGFNDRDGTILIAWDTSEDIEPGLGAEAYEIQSIRITMTNQVNEFVSPQWPIDLTVDEWFTFVEGGVDDDPGRPIELFGVAFGPATSEALWNETTFYNGSSSTADLPRDPFPFVYQEETFEALHVEDCVKGLHNEGLSTPLCDDPDGICPFTPTPWAIGVPTGYTPGSQVAPFDVTFDINLELSDGHVKQYFQEQLNNGRILVFVTSLRETAVQGPASGFPSFYMKEGVPLDPNARAGRLELVLGNAVTGDLNSDEAVDLTDWSGFADCLSGEGVAPFPVEPLTVEQCLCTYDFDRDGDVDLLDAGDFAIAFSGP